MLDHRLRRWTKIKPVLVQRLLFAGKVTMRDDARIMLDTQKHETLTQCRSDAGPPSAKQSQHQTSIGWSISCLLDAGVIARRGVRTSLSTYWHEHGSQYDMHLLIELDVHIKPNFGSYIFYHLC